MTTEVLFTPTPSSSSGNNVQVAPLICEKGAEQFGNGGTGSRRSRRNRSMGDSENAEKGSPKTMRSPRCEAFVMTGEKMLSLNPKISPLYAKVCQNQLPPTVEVDAPSREQQQTTNPLDAFHSLHHRSGDKGRHRQKKESPMIVPFPQSDQFPEEAVKGMRETIGDDRNHPTGNNGGEAIDRQNHQQQQKLEEESERAAIALAEEGEGATTDETKRMHMDRTPISTSHGSKSTPTTPSKGNCQLNILKRHRTIPANEMEQTKANGQGRNEEDAKRSANERCQNQKRDNQQMNERIHFAVEPIDPSMSARSSIDLTWLNSPQSVAFPAETVARMARHLFTHRDGFRGTNPSTVLGKRDELSMRITCEFLALFNFAGLRVDVALRDFLVHVPLCGDTLEREQLLENFAKRYYECNPTVFSSADDVQFLASALLLLSADLHGKIRSSSERAMNCREFIDNLSHLEHNKFDTAMLRELYVAVSERSFNCKPENDETEESVQSTSFERKHHRRFSGLLSSKRRGSAAISEPRSSSLAGTIVDPEQQVDYKHGWLLRKCIYDADGKRTPFGRRRWRMHYVTVRGMVLYLHQDEHSFSSICRYVTFRNCILLHHALAEPCRDYTKRRNVFRLRTAQLGESLFQTSEPAEVQCWCDAINYVAAAFSTPALPSPVGANGLVAFYRPHLPATATQLSIPDQLRAHEQRMEETALNLVHLRDKAPPMKAKGRVVHEYFYKERFLETEKNRYSVYVSILREKLTRASSVLRCGDSFSSNAVLSSCKKTAQNNGISADFGEKSRECRPCSSLASQMDDELLDEDGTTANFANVEQLQSAETRNPRHHKNQLQRLRMNI